MFTSGLYKKLSKPRNNSLLMNLWKTYISECELLLNRYGFLSTSGNQFKGTHDHYCL